MTDALEALLDSLLYEGYALYPYTPGATKNATPTPFGIVYPPAYAAALATTYDHVELRCLLDAPADAVLRGEVRFLASSGERHQAQPHVLSIGGAMVGALTGEGAARDAIVRCADGSSLTVRVCLAAAGPQPGGDYEVSLRVENRTVVSSGLDRGGALRRSLLSTHPIMRVSGGRFVSGLERPCACVNTFPVLAAPGDDVVLGATFVLPDHPQIAPESRGGLFDSTEIEEALLLHVQALSDAEREEIERQDPAVRAMIARAAAATRHDITALHGRVTIRDPEATEPPRHGPESPEPPRHGRESTEPPRHGPESTEPPREPAWLADPRAGEEVAHVCGMTLQRGATLRLRPHPGADMHARMLAGRRATLERIFIAYDGRTHLGVTIDEDPGQELMRETGRYLFFFPEEVEVIRT